jgi:cell division protein ZipA
MELELRIALLLIGLAAIVAMYFFGKSKRALIKREDDEYNFETSDLPDPLELDRALELSDDLKQEVDAISEEGAIDAVGDDISNLVREDIAESPRITVPKDKPSFSHQPSLLDSEPEPSEQVEKLVILHVIARRPQKFNGKAILNLSKELELELNNSYIFNKNVERFSGKKALYSVVNMVKPGTFDADGMHEFETPGLSFILSLPGPEEGLRAFNIMLEDARKLSERLNGDLLDESRNRLNPQMTAHLQEDIQLFSLRHPRPVSA